MGANCCGLGGRHEEEAEVFLADAALSPPPVPFREVPASAVTMTTPRLAKKQVQTPLPEPPLDSEGYVSVASTMNKDAMKTFARRLVLERRGCIDGAKAEAELEGIARWHSNGHSMASFDLLVDELERSAWAQLPESPRASNAWQAEMGMTGLVLQGKNRTLSSWYNSSAPKPTQKEETLSMWYLDGQDRPDTSQQGATQEYEISSFTADR
eukprot:gb/GFBE01055102.1/.p1 GENE.gb/GFBE01055102.1/~~gb/GFBE01055102.1/.p1  ORF type:complete len:211 (+),score=43.99 gb/GFBE01055102.1/:1-633(+)